MKLVDTTKPQGVKMSDKIYIKLTHNEDKQGDNRPILLHQ